MSASLYSKNIVSSVSIFKYSSPSMNNNVINYTTMNIVYYEYS